MKNQLRMYLVEAREKLGYSQYRVALNANMTHQHYNMIENGKVNKNVSFRALVSIGAALKIPFNELIELEFNYQKVSGGLEAE